MFVIETSELLVHCIFALFCLIMGPMAAAAVADGSFDRRAYSKNILRKGRLLTDKEANQKLFELGLQAQKASRIFILVLAISVSGQAVATVVLVTFLADQSIVGYLLSLVLLTLVSCIFAGKMGRSNAYENLYKFAATEHKRGLAEHLKIKVSQEAMQPLLNSNDKGYLTMIEYYYLDTIAIEACARHQAQEPDRLLGLDPGKAGA